MISLHIQYALYSVRLLSEFIVPRAQKWFFMEYKTQLKSNITGEQLLTLSMDMGEKMIICGAEANRVEDTIRRICLAYGCTKVDVFSITSYLSTTIRLPDGTHDTQTRRIHSYSNNLDKLEYLNAISRHICNNTPAYNNIETEIADIKKDRNFPWYMSIFGYILSSSAFAVFFGGSIRDGLIAGLLSTIAYIMDLKDVQFFLYIPARCTGTFHRTYRVHRQSGQGFHRACNALYTRNPDDQLHPRHTLRRYYVRAFKAY